LDYLKGVEEFDLFESPMAEKVAPNYSTIIKHPIDFKTMELKLEKYEDYSEFRRDLQRISNNCRLHNLNVPYFQELSNRFDECVGRLGVGV
jgi:hypothetical protein